MTDDSVTGYLARGWSIVALHGVVEGNCTCDQGQACKNPGKHPLYRNWQKVPITDLGVWNAISGWRLARGLPTNVGLATGRPSNVFALDVDPKNGGLRTLQEYEAAGRVLPPTWEQRTGGQGLHCLFTMPADFEPTNATGRLGAGLDIRGTGGQIVLAPSVTDKGSYEITRDAIPWAAPHWLLDDIRPMPYDRPAVAHDPETIDGRGGAYAARTRDIVLRELAQESSSRNSRAFVVACRLHELLNAGWLDYDTTYDAYLAAAEQASGNKPDPFDQREADGVWRNAANHTMDKTADLPPDTWGGERLDFPQGKTDTSDSSPRPATSAPGSSLFAEPFEKSASTSAAIPGISDLNLPPEFWDARPVLKHLQLAAHSRLVSADVVLHSVLVRLASLWPHQVKLDTGMLNPASANLFTAVVGPSGAGKTAGVGLARRLLERPYWLPQETYADDRPLGSGEGMSEVFMGQKVVDKLDENGHPMMDTKGVKKTEKVRAQVRHNALLHADEGEVLAKMLERQGATVGVELRRAWSGGTIGQSNGRSETTRVIEEGRYSLGLVIGFQLNTVQRLLTADDTTSGTTQRFLFCWALDPSVPHERLPDPGPLRGIWPERSGGEGLVWLADPGGSKEVDLRPVTYAEAIQEQLWQERYARVTTTTPEHEDMASQRPATLIKISALLAYLDGGRRQVTEEDWRLAGMVWDTSCAVRDYAINLGRVAAGKAAEARRSAHSAQELAVLDAVEAREDQAVERVAIQMARALQAKGERLTFSAFRHKAAPRDRQRAATAAHLAVERQWAVLADDGRYEPGPVRL